MFSTGCSFAPPLFLVGLGGAFIWGIGEQRVDGRASETPGDLIEQVLAISARHHEVPQHTVATTHAHRRARI
jgi:hypothetical protein